MLEERCTSRLPEGGQPVRAERAWAGQPRWGRVAANTPQWQEDAVLAARTVGTSKMGSGMLGMGC